MHQTRPPAALFQLAKGQSPRACGTFLPHHPQPMSIQGCHPVAVLCNQPLSGLPSTACLKSFCKTTMRMAVQLQQWCPLFQIHVPLHPVPTLMDLQVPIRWDISLQTLSICTSCLHSMYAYLQGRSVTQSLQITAGCVSWPLTFLSEGVCQHLSGRVAKITFLQTAQPAAASSNTQPTILMHMARTVRAA